MPLDRPIILLGFHRSGTSMLGRIFEQHPLLAYWSEPRHVWMHHFIYRRYDVLSAADARPAVVRQIARDFEHFLSACEGRTRFAEKTPSNMVRLPFIREVFPDARIIHIIRDGRASAFSTMKVLERPPQARLVRRRMGHTPLWHYPAYIPKAWRTLVRPRLTGKTIPYWGPRIPGLRRWARELPLDELCAKQWQATLRITLRDAEYSPRDQYREWRYEDLVQTPIPVVRAMFDFGQLSWPQHLDSWLRENIHQESLTKWRENLSDEQIARIMPHLQPLLGELGYVSS